MVDARLILFAPSCSPAILRKIHQYVTLNSQWLQNGSKKIVLGCFTPRVWGYTIEQKEQNIIGLRIISYIVGLLAHYTCM